MPIIPALRRQRQRQKDPEFDLFFLFSNALSDIVVA
jgi:hypothetical protein